MLRKIYNFCRKLFLKTYSLSLFPHLRAKENNHSVRYQKQLQKKKRGEIIYFKLKIDSQLWRDGICLHGLRNQINVPCRMNRETWAN